VSPKKNNYQLVASPIEFTITCSSNGKTVTVSKFNNYVERTIAIPEGVDPGKITTAVILNNDGSFSHVPTEIVVIDGKYYAKINSLSNSTYTVIYNPKSFADVEGHWAKSAVNDMASRLVISGAGNGNFEPDREISRGELAAIVVRGLGLMNTGIGKTSFSDVDKKEWYYDAVSIAYENELISGYPDGSFQPSSKISREEAMVIIARAMRVAGIENGISYTEAEEVLDLFSDSGSVSQWAELAVADCVKAGIVKGGNGQIKARSKITRAEVATLIKTLLQEAGLI